MTPDRPGLSTPRLIGLDWGTTAMRCWLLGDNGRILDARRLAGGLLDMATGIDAADPAARARAYEATFLDVCGPWLRAVPGLPALACGMVGSAQGWREAGYLDVPARLDITGPDLTRVPLAGGTVHLVPGLRVPSDPCHDIAGDVLRGEETQVIGALESLDRPDAEHVLVLPGTHTKWIRIADRKVLSFTTAMTGELYALVTQHGLLSHTGMTPRRDDAAFARGLTAGFSARDIGLAATLFGARALVLDGLLEPAALADYLSGVVIADEARHLLPRHAGTQRITLCGNGDLCRRYAAALRMRGVGTEVVGEDAAAAGLWSVAVAAGLVGVDGNTCWPDSGKRTPARRDSWSA
ncbi:2-dehydro-3-deoxygalactonokinase [Nocardia sp. NBC_01329]|uniref:2-dehydro-3-deoxygalactonokinase n=1 Tax=Nocardia sp. NBC_01329 TaxID=2903594 RepID=UPI002E108528|nr:2-dehydro-3-deoxygalactonokinase [Nocardia sp. NBC_01329]